MLNLKAGDFSTGAAQFNVFIFGEYRDFTQKYHNSKAHIVCSLINNIGLISVDIGALKPRKYGLCVEGIIDPKDDGSRFDIDNRTFTTPKMITRTRYKEKIDPHAVAMDMEIEVTNEIRNYIFGIDIDHVPNNEIALFIFGRRGEGRVDPQIIDNINYYEKIKIPRYRSFEVNADRRSEIGFASTFTGGVLVLKKFLGEIHKDYYPHYFNFSRGNPPIGKYFEFRFPCIISLDKLKLRQEKDVSQGNWQVKYLDEKDGFSKTHMMTPSLGMEKNLKLRWMKMLEEYSDFSLLLADYTSGRVLIKFIQFPSHLKKLTFSANLL